MSKYIALRDTWISHECRLVKAEAEFETTFPIGMTLSGNIRLVEDTDPKGKKAKLPADDQA